jgi:hypothetical protein
MATQFPTNLDNFTNPLPGDKLNSPSHSTQHTNANDAIEAIEAVIGVTGSTDPNTITGSLSNKVPYTGATANVNLGENGISSGFFQADLTPSSALQVGRMQWNDADGTMEMRLKGNNVTLQIGQEQLIRVVNKTGADLLEANYQCVKISGAQGQRPKVALAQANNDANSADTIGLVTETIANNQEGFVTDAGIVSNINTTGSLQGETWIDGDVLYLSGTVAGRLTKVKPQAPIHGVIVGFVIHAHNNQGKIYVKVDNGYKLDDLHNVKIVSPTNNQILQYTSATGLWENKTASFASGTVTSVSGTGSYGGLSLTGTVTSSGSLTFGGTPTGTWPIGVTGNAGTVTNGVYTTGDQTIAGIKTFSGASTIVNGNLGVGVTPSAWGALNYFKAVQVGNRGGALAGNTLSYSSSPIVYLTNNSFFQDSDSTFRYVSSQPAVNYRQFNGEHNWYTAPSGTAGNAITFTQAMTLDASGNLGIGLTTPTDKLHVYSGSTGTATFEGSYSFSAENYNIRLKNDGTTSGYLSQVPAAGGIIVADGMRYYGSSLWTPDGTSASSFQQLSGNFIFTSNTGLTGGVNFTSTERMRITSAGDVGIGVVSPTVKLDVAGSILASGNVTAYSDIRVKDNVESIEGAIGKLNQIRGVTYTRTDLDDKHRRFAGVIAQEIEQVLPEAVFDNGKVKAVDYNATIALLIEAVKEQQKRIDKLETLLNKGN